MFLRPMEPEDVELVHGWQEDGEHRRLMGDPPRSLAMRRRRFDELLSQQGGDFFSFVICRIEDGQAVGRTDLFNVDRLNGVAAFGIGIGEPAYAKAGFVVEARRRHAWVEAVAWSCSTRPTMGSTTIDTAISRMMAGALVTCPPDPECGKTPAPKIGD